MQTKVCPPGLSNEKNHPVVLGPQQASMRPRLRSEHERYIYPSTMIEVSRGLGNWGKKLQPSNEDGHAGLTRCSSWGDYSWKTIGSVLSTSSDCSVEVVKQEICACTFKKCVSAMSSLLFSDRISQPVSVGVTSITFWRSFWANKLLITKVRLHPQLRIFPPPKRTGSNF